MPRDSECTERSCRVDWQSVSSFLSRSLNELYFLSASVALSIPCSVVSKLRLHDGGCVPDSFSANVASTLRTRVRPNIFEVVYRVNS